MSQVSSILSLHLPLHPPPHWHWKQNHFKVSYIWIGQYLYWWLPWLPYFLLMYNLETGAMDSYNSYSYDSVAQPLCCSQGTLDPYSTASYSQYYPLQQGPDYQQYSVYPHPMPVWYSSSHQDTSNPGSAFTTPSPIYPQAYPAVWDSELCLAQNPFGDLVLCSKSTIFRPF